MIHKALSDRRVRLVLLALAALFVLAWVALTELENSGHEGVARIARRTKRTLLKWFGVAAAVLIAGVGLWGAPWYIAAGAAVTILTVTGALPAALHAAGIPVPSLPGSGSGDERPCRPETYGQTMPDGSICLGIGG